MLLLTALSCLAAACGARDDAGTTSDSSPGVAAATAASPADAGEVRQAIEAANARFKAAYLRGDTTTIVDNYADDVILLPPNVEAVRGRDAVRQRLAREVAEAPSMVKDFKITTEDVLVSGELAVETGTVEFIVQPKTGNPVSEKGKYVTVWKRQADGSWKIVRDAFNSSSPPPKS
jgi:uncharacterized protein (TIGR02246 family)